MSTNVPAVLNSGNSEPNTRAGSCKLLTGQAPPRPYYRHCIGDSKSSLFGDYLPRKCGIATFTSDLLAPSRPRIRKASAFASR